MKGLKTTLITVVAIGLLAGSAVGASAQDQEAGQMASALIVFDFVEATDGGNLYEASDPRASGVLEWSDDGSFEHGGSDGHLRLTFRDATITSEGGAWTGTGTVISAERFQDPQMDRGLAIWELTGEGDYEGLRLSLFVEGHVGREHAQWGFIYPTDAVELPAE